MRSQEIILILIRRDHDCFSVFRHSCTLEVFFKILLVRIYAPCGCRNTDHRNKHHHYQNQSDQTVGSFGFHNNLSFFVFSTAQSLPH